MEENNKNLIEVSDQEVRISFVLNSKCRANVRLRSLCAASTVAFKVQTSSPQKFMVNPPSGLISPLSYATFQIILKPQTQLPHSFPRSPSDRFLIRTALFSPGSPVPAPAPEKSESEFINSWFTSRGHVSTQDYKLKVAFVGPVLLRHVIGNGDCETARNLIKRQKSVLAELSVKESESILRVATELAEPEDMVNLLLDSGLKVGGRVEMEEENTRGVDSKWGSRGWDELHVAAAFDRTEEVLGLVEVRGSGSLDRGDKEGRTPLHVAAGKGNIRCTRVLVESGADKDAKSRDGRTALHRAAANGDRPMVEMLIEMGADPTITNDRGRSPLDVARDKGHSEVVEILERGEAVLMAARRGDLKHLESLLRTGATINYQDQYGLTALHAAAMKGHRDVLAMLIEFGGDLESQDDEGHSPLHLAVVGGSLEAVVALVGKGANVNVESNSKATPLYMATAMGQRDIAEFLVSRGASSSKLHLTT